MQLLCGFVRSDYILTPQYGAGAASKVQSQLMPTLLVVCLLQLYDTKICQS